MAKTIKCPCCRQSSNLRKTACSLCDAYAMQSRSQIGDGLHPCRCGGTLEPVCLEDRARCFPDTDYGRHAWAEYAYRYVKAERNAPSLSHRQGVQTRKLRKACAVVRLASEPVMPF